MGGVFYFMGDATMIDEALNIAKIVTIAIGTGYSIVREEVRGLPNESALIVFCPAYVS